MTRPTIVVLATACLISLGIAYSASAQQPAAEGAARQRGAGAAAAPREGAAVHPPLFFRLDWTQAADAKEHPVTQEGVGNPNIELKLYGPDGKDIAETGNIQDPTNNPVHVWTGLCTSPCAVGLRDKNNYVDLTGLAKIKWVTKVAGFHKVRPIVKLADGTWLVGDHADGSTVDWHENEFSLSEVHWRKLDIDKVLTMAGDVDKADLSKVDEIGFADLMAGSGHGNGGWSDVASIEVYGKPVSRTAAVSQLNNN